MIPLDELKIGEQAEIETIETDKLPLKLIEMGCLPGSAISLIQNAPFNDPLYIKIDEVSFGNPKGNRERYFCSFNRLVS
jgi:ferrous iron transport protein A